MMKLETGSYRQETIREEGGEETTVQTPLETGADIWRGWGLTDR